MTAKQRAKFTLRIPEILHEVLESESKKKGIPMNALVLQILHEHLIKKSNP